MPAFNLPQFTPPPPTTEPTSPSKRPHRERAGERRKRPPPLRLQTEDADSVEGGGERKSSPAQMRSPYDKTWGDLPYYHRSPLSSTFSPRKQPTPPQQPKRRLSRRYLPLPHHYPLCIRPPIQQSITIPRAFQAHKDPRMFEEIVARVLEKRLRDKCLRGKSTGERAGLGVSGGREMRLLAALGVVRESRMTVRGLGCSSAPPTQLNFSLDYPAPRPSTFDDSPVPSNSPLRRDPPPSVLVAQSRALGHRKSASISSPYPSTAPAGTFRPGLFYKKSMSLGLGGGLPTLESIKDMINSKRNGEIVLGEKERLAQKLARGLILLGEDEERRGGKENGREDERRGRGRERETSKERRRAEKRLLTESSLSSETTTPVARRASAPSVVVDLKESPPTTSSSPTPLKAPPSPAPSTPQRPSRHSRKDSYTPMTRSPTSPSSPSSPNLPSLAPPPISRSVSSPSAPTQKNTAQTLTLPSSPAPAFLRRRSTDSIFARERAPPSSPAQSPSSASSSRSWRSRGNSDFALPKPLYPIAASEY